MRRFYIFILLAYCAFFVSSCDIIGSNESPKEVEVKQIVELPDTVKQHLIKQDSLYSGLIAKIDTLTNELNVSQQNVAQLQKDLDKLESPESFWNYMTVGAIILSLLSIVFVIFVRSKALSENDVRRIVMDYLDNSRRLNELQKKVQDLERAKNTSSYSKYMPTGPASRKAEDRIAYLEGKIKEIIDVVNRHDTQIKNSSGMTSTYPSTPLSTPSKPKQPEFSKDGYAKLNSNKFFFEILDSNQEGCVFHINFKSENRGEFDIISLDKIKSRNGWQDVVEITGNCTMADALRYDVVSKGICVKTSSGYWEVQDNLKIKISK